MKKTTLFAAAGLLALLAAAGCSPQTEEAAEETGRTVTRDTERAAERTGEAAEGTAERTGEAAEGAAERAGEAAGRAGEAVGDAARTAADATQQAAAPAVLTPRVKAALMADDQINANNINVETDMNTNTVILKGAARSQNEKTRATEVAQRTLRDMKSDFKVRNDLTVSR